MRCRWLVAILVLPVAGTGCGTSTWSDTKRTATEQLLISDAMDRAVSRLDLRALAGKEVFLDSDALKSVTDHEYLTSSLRQHMLASGCILKDKEQEADYILEVRSGAVGTDRHDVLYGMPAVNIPPVLPLSGVPSTIPEIPLAKKTDQRAVTKIAVFGYNRRTGRPVWQSGVVPVESQAKDIWVFGAGPFQRGTIYEGTNFAGDELNIPLIDLGTRRGDRADSVSVADEAYFIEPEEEVASNEPQPVAQDATETGTAEKAALSSPKVIPAGHTAPAADPPNKTPPAKAQAADAPLPPPKSLSGG